MSSISSYKYSRGINSESNIDWGLESHRVNLLIVSGEYRED